MAATIALEGGAPVPVVVWRDDAQARDATHTVYWPLDCPDPVIGLGVVRAGGGPITFRHTAAVYDVLAAGEPVILDTDDCANVPPRVFVVERLEVTHATDDPASTRLIRAQVQNIEAP